MNTLSDTMARNPKSFNGIKVPAGTGPKITTIPRINVRDIIIDSTVNKIIDPHIIPNVEFSQDAYRCYNLPDIEFTNCLPRLDEAAIASDIELAIKKLGENCEIILDGKTYVNVSGRHKDRIESILKQYISDDKYESCIDYIYKSDVREASLNGDRGKFRIVSLYVVKFNDNLNQGNTEHKLVVLFFDPYHLFIPSSDFGTTIYSTVANYTSDFQKLISKYILFSN